MIPDFFHALTAWRKFDIAGHARILASAGHTDHWWPTADLGEAICRAYQNHDAPQLECTCGFYCFKARVDAEQHQQGSILARVEIWGRLAEHRRGYRAQHMRIQELFVSSSFSARPALESRYRVPVTVDQGADKWISENPYGLSPLNQSQSHPANQFAQIQWTNPYMQGGQSPSYQSGLANLLGGMSNHSQQLAQAQYNQPYQAALQGMVPQIMMTPKAPFVLPAGASIPPPTTLPPVKVDWEEITDEEETPVEVHEAEIVEDFDPVADRVTKRLTGKPGNW